MPTKHLGDGELSVLKALWDLGDAQVKEVQAQLQEQGHDLAYNTVQTVLGRLVEKGLVACDKSAAAHRFRAKVARERFRRDRLRDMVSKVFDGSAGAMAFQLVENGGLDAGEIEQLQEMLQDLASKQKSKKARTRRKR